MTQGQRSISVNFRPYLRQLIWHELGMISLVLMELTWVLPWFRSITPSIQANQGQSSFFMLLFFLLLVTYANRVLRAIDMQAITHRLILVAILLVGLYSLSSTLVYPGLSLGFGEIIHRTLLSLENVFNNIPEGFLVILMGLYLFWRGIAISSGSLEIRMTERKFRFGILMLGIFGIVFRGSQVTYLLNVLPIYFAAGLLAVTFSRTSSLGRGITAYRLPYTLSWFLGMISITTLTVLLGLFSSRALQSKIAEEVFGFFSRSFGQIMDFLQILLLPLIEVFIYIAEKITEFLSRIIDPESLPGTPDEFQPFPTPELPFEQGEPLIQISPVVTILIVLLILALLVFLIVRRANRRYRYRVPVIDDEGETIFEPEEIQSRLRRFIYQVREGIELVRTFGLGRQMLAATVIRRIYTRLLNLAADLGYPRQRSETPYEFQKRLMELFPEQRQQVDLITDAYVHVRYGEVPEEDRIIKLVEDAWELIDKEARNLGRGIRA